MKWFSEHWYLAVLAFALCGGGALLTASARADGRADYCRLLWTPASGPIKGYWLVEAHRPWRSDVILGAFMDDGEARRFAGQQNCELH